ncbi:helix-turn-helix domain-containing protein [Proteiniphilum acetatigenes]|uniref:helix-turn-helix domain-containing protein n=1 Tax=Proteiniphilum acetatigenes TaxID=294710 RepID=UPI0012F93975|nr:helix-turn-helix transcriptional regulator [Proteiniphilum acetatigenes]
MVPVLREEEEKPIKSSEITFSQIEKAVGKWEQQKLFTNPKITITKVAAQVSTNRSYLSQYINRSKQKTFNEWINELRIEEAKKLMANNKNMTIEEVSEKVGYTDKSYFSKCFVRYIGITASQWKEKHL